MVYVDINHGTPISPRLSGDDAAPILSRMTLGNSPMVSREGDTWTPGYFVPTGYDIIQAVVFKVTSIDVT